jgi:hypothetical protein
LYNGLKVINIFLNDNKFMKVAVIRGPMLNKYEMQSYEPLTKYFDITAFYSSNPETIHLINLKKKS